MEEILYTVSKDWPTTLPSNLMEQPVSDVLMTQKEPMNEELREFVKSEVNSGLNSINLLGMDRSGKTQRLFPATNSEVPQRKLPDNSTIYEAPSSPTLFAAINEDKDEASGTHPESDLAVRTRQPDEEPSSSTNRRTSCVMDKEEAAISRVVDEDDDCVIIEETEVSTTGAQKRRLINIWGDDSEWNAATPSKKMETSGKTRTVSSHLPAVIAAENFLTAEEMLKDLYTD